jgi:hypothetical protein
MVMLVGNFDYAGTNKFKSHILLDSEKRTACGLYMSERRGDWQLLDVQEHSDQLPSCLKCRKAAQLTLNSDGLAPDETRGENSETATGSSNPQSQEPAG